MLNEEISFQEELIKSTHTIKLCQLFCVILIYFFYMEIVSKLKSFIQMLSGQGSRGRGGRVVGVVRVVGEVKQNSQLHTMCGNSTTFTPYMYVK